MPYRRLPKTDQARIRTLRTITERAIEDGRFNSVISYKSYASASSFLQKFETAVQDYLQNLALYKEENRRGGYTRATRKCRMYLSHFIQVYQFSVMRGDIPQKSRIYYNLPPERDTLPDLSTDISLYKWGECTIEGERKRVKEGGVPIYNPTIARVTVWYEQFKEAYLKRTSLRKETERCLNHVAGMRTEGDALIFDLWNQIEEFFSTSDSQERIEACARFGIIYYTRKDRQKSCLQAENEID